MAGRCEFCDLRVNAEDSVSCQFCNGVFCDSECFDAHLVGFPQCGGDPPREIQEQAHQRVFGKAMGED